LRRGSRRRDPTIAFCWEIEDSDDEEAVEDDTAKCLEWSQGRVKKYIGDEGDCSDESGELLNFVVHYPADGDQIQALHLDCYDARRSAPVGSWYIVKDCRRR
jgi:hypothetical protein